MNVWGLLTVSTWMQNVGYSTVACSVEGYGGCHACKMFLHGEQFKGRMQDTQFLAWPLPQSGAAKWNSCKVGPIIRWEKLVSYFCLAARVCLSVRCAVRWAEGDIDSEVFVLGNAPASDGKELSTISLEMHKPILSDSFQVFFNFLFQVFIQFSFWLVLGSGPLLDRCLSEFAMRNTHNHRQDSAPKPSWKCDTWNLDPIMSFSDKGDGPLTKGD